MGNKILPSNACFRRAASAPVHHGQVCTRPISHCSFHKNVSHSLIPQKARLVWKVRMEDEFSLGCTMVFLFTISFSPHATVSPQFFFYSAANTLSRTQTSPFHCLQDEFKLLNLAYKSLCHLGPTCSPTSFPTTPNLKYSAPATFSIQCSQQFAAVWNTSCCFMSPCLGNYLIYPYHDTPTQPHSLIH